jgi:indolepyruvate ferredoxin oxidoreductase
VLPLFRVLAGLKWLRGTPFDPFGRTTERRTERQLVKDYAARVERLLSGLSTENYETVVKLAALPQKIRGFGHVKQRNLEIVRKEQKALLDRFENPAPTVAVAAE